MPDPRQKIRVCLRDLRAILTENYTKSLFKWLHLF